MPKSFGKTQKGKLFHWTRNNPGEYTVSELAKKFNITKSWTNGILRELTLNYPHRIYKEGEKWVIK